MVAARKQRQAQKLQEQQSRKRSLNPRPARIMYRSVTTKMTTRLAKPKKSLHRAQETSGSAPADDASDDDDGDDEPIEVVSNKISRKQASQNLAKQKAQEKAEKAQRQAAEAKRAKKQKKQANLGDCHGG